MNLHNPKTTLSEVLLALLVLFSGLCYLNPIFAVPVVAVAVMWGIQHRAQHETLRQQKDELIKANKAFSQACDLVAESMSESTKLSEQVGAMQAQIDALKSANAISFGQVKR